MVELILVAEIWGQYRLVGWCPSTTEVGVCQTWTRTPHAPRSLQASAN